MDFLEARDQGIWNFLQTHRQPWLDPMMAVFSFLGSPLVLTLLVVVGLAVLCVRRRHRTGTVLAAAFVGGIGVLIGVRELVGRVRPRSPLEEAAETPCFPSERAFLATVVCLGLVLLLAPGKRWPLVAAGGLVFLIGISRAYIGVCYPSDVVGGWMGGLAWVLACQMAGEKWTRQEQLPG
jgi:undecaprenyl-diphosphatase